MLKILEQSKEKGWSFCQYFRKPTKKKWKKLGVKKGLQCRNYFWKISTVIPQYPWGITSRIPQKITKPNMLNKPNNPECLHITSSVWIQCSTQRATNARFFWNSVKFLPKYFQFTLVESRCQTHGYGKPTVPRLMKCSLANEWYLLA